MAQEKPIFPDPDTREWMPSGSMPKWANSLVRVLKYAGIPIMVALLFLNRPQGPQQNQSTAPKAAPGPLGPQPRPIPPLPLPPAPTKTPPQIPTEQIAPAPLPGSQSSTPEKSRLEQVAEQIKDKRREIELKAAFDNNKISDAGPREPIPSTPLSTTVPAPSEVVATRPSAQRSSDQDLSRKDPLEFNHKQPLYWLPEGTVLEAALEEELKANFSGTADAELTTNVYYSGTKLLLLPQGAKIKGRYDQVRSSGQNRVALTFQKILIYPSFEKGIDPYSIALNQDPGLSQQGDTGLPGKTNNHIASLLLAAAAVGIIQGASVATYGGSTNSPTIGIYNGLGQSTAEVMARILEPFLNRLPEITVRPGTRIKVRLLESIQVPAYPVPTTPFAADSNQ